MSNIATECERPPAIGDDDDRRALRAVMMAHQGPVLRRSLGQIASTFLPFFALIAAAYLLRGISVWLTLALTVPAAGLVVRIFIIQHDCGHGAFFRNRAANEWVGRFCSLFTMTPFANWRYQHANHHAVWNNLDRRLGGADIYSTCMTVPNSSRSPASVAGGTGWCAIRSFPTSCCHRLSLCCSSVCRLIRRLHCDVDGRASSSPTSAWSRSSLSSFWYWE